MEKLEFDSLENNSELFLPATIIGIHLNPHNYKTYDISLEKENSKEKNYRNVARKKYINNVPEDYVVSHDDKLLSFCKIYCIIQDNNLIPRTSGRQIAFCDKKNNTRYYNYTMVAKNNQIIFRKNSVERTKDILEQMKKLFIGKKITFDLNMPCSVDEYEKYVDHTGTIKDITVEYIFDVYEVYFYFEDGFETNFDVGNEIHHYIDDNLFTYEWVGATTTDSLIIRIEEIIKLRDVKNEKDFELYYKFWNLNSFQEKKDWLHKCMGIIMTKGEPMTEKEELNLLQIHALNNWDRKETEFETEQIQKIVSSL